MQVSIPKTLEAFVRRKVEAGQYRRSEAEVVADALRLVQARDEIVAMKRERLRDALDRGYEDVAAGRVIELETEDDIDTLFASL
jgi:antitoxin ParD1/3/4